MSNKTFYMLCGMPAVGKSTFIANTVDERLIPSFHVVSTDDLIECVAGFYDTSYNKVFGLGIFPEIEKITLTIAKKVFEEGHPTVFWDQTNLTRKSRQKKLEMVPNDYYKICVCLGAPDPAEWKRRLNSRPGKVIPEHILKSMQKTFELPNTEEGFDEVLFVNFPKVEI